MIPWLAVACNLNQIQASENAASILVQQKIELLRRSVSK